MKHDLKKDIVYGGSLHEQLWNVNNNPNATIGNCLANCTTLAYGLSKIKPVSRIVGASNWHKYLTNGFTAIPFDRTKVKEGDIIEWVNHVHVAIVDKVENGNIWLHCSWYTGDHGTAMWNGHYDTRSFSSLKEVSDFMANNYPTRMYHYFELEDECRGVGGDPQYILVRPNIIPEDGRNELVDQILTLTNEQNVRSSPEGEIIGVAQKGYFDTFDSQISGKYLWYKIREGWIALVDGRVEFIEGEDDIKKLKKENAQLKERLRQIHELSEV